MPMHKSKTMKKKKMAKGMAKGGIKKAKGYARGGAARRR